MLATSSSHGFGGSRALGTSGAFENTRDFQVGCGSAADVTGTGRAENHNKYIHEHLKQIPMRHAARTPPTLIF